MTSVALPAAAAPRFHRAAQRIGLALTALLLLGLVLSPDVTLRVLWDMVIPLLPAVFLVNPVLWRNVCPLATINSLTARRAAVRRLDLTFLGAPLVIGLALLAIMVPARRFLFNVDGLVLAITIVGVAGLAALAGMLFPRRSGFCNAVCPVLPVEKLYGQSPLVQIGTARCGDCSVCTPTGCIELAGEKMIAQTIGPARRSSAWLVTAFGAFAAAFPGFIFGYFTTENGPLTTAWNVYAHVAAWSLASYAIIAAFVALTRVSARVAMPVLGGLSIGLYYWFAAPALITAYGLPESGGNVLRAAAYLLIGVWAMFAWRRAAGRSDLRKSVSLST